MHLDVDVIAQEEFAAVNVPGSGGLSFSDVRDSLAEFAKHKNLLGLDVAQYNPEKDLDGSAARKLIDLLAEVLSARLSALSAPVPPAVPAAEETSSSASG